MKNAKRVLIGVLVLAGLITGIVFLNKFYIVLAVGV